MGLFVDDGRTHVGYIAAIASLGLPALRFTYREAVNHERNAMYRANQEATKQGDDKLAHLLARNVLDWDASDAKGSAVPVTGDAISRLRATMLNRLYLIVIGADGSDPEPVPEEDHVEAERQAFISVNGGTALAAEVAMTKN